MTEIDRSVLEWFVDHREPWLTTLMQVVTFLGGSAFLIPLGVALGAWYWWRRGRRRPFALLGAAYTGALLLSNSIKWLTDRARPPDPLAIGTYDSPAFPSGHATHAAAVWLMVAVVTAARARGRREKVAAWAAAAAIVVLVGVSRLYLAAHWLTDVLAGWAIGGLWAFVVVVASRRAISRTARR